jgi:hypothetical protein
LFAKSAFISSMLSKYNLWLYQIIDIQKHSNCTLPCGERAALVALQPSQLLKVTSPNHASGLTSKQLLAWFLGIWGTRREQHLLKYAGPCGANPQQCEFALGNNQGLLALRGPALWR